MGRAIQAGRVWTNCYHLYPAHAAFGGYKVSGVGRENHKMMLDHYSQTKCLSGQLRPKADRVLLGAAGMTEHVIATDAALAAIEQLEQAHGAVMFFQSGGCCDGSSPICLPEGELPTGPSDLLLGRPAGASFFVDAELFQRWNQPAFTLDLASGHRRGFSLAGPADTHFITRSTQPDPDHQRKARS